MLFRYTLENNRVNVLKNKDITYMKKFIISSLLSILSLLGVVYADANNPIQVITILY